MLLSDIPGLRDENFRKEDDEIKIFKIKRKDFQKSKNLWQSKGRIVIG